MNLLTLLAISLVMILHIAFFILEMFFWKKPAGRKIFHLKKDFAEQSATLAANQGLYNGFLAAGLAWGLLDHNTQVLDFFLGFIIIAGIYGAVTASRMILFLQALPAAIAVLLLWQYGLDTPAAT